MRLAKQNFWRPIPQRDDLMRVRPQRDGIRPRESKVSQLKHARRTIYQDILRLKVSVNDPVCVTTARALKEEEEVG